MLPEKRKNLIIAIIAIILLVILVIGLASISNYIKERSDTEKANANYLDKYTYFGISYDSIDTLYKIYGITSDYKEEYLDIGTFYLVKDAYIKDNRLVMYSDATNELRYDNKNNEYYFYEIDSNYNRSSNIILTDKYIINTTIGIITIHEYATDVANDLKVNDSPVIGDVFLANNKLYYSLQNGIYEYDLNTKESKRLIYNTEEVPLVIVKINEKYIYYYNLGNVPMLYRIDNQRIIDLSTNLDLEETSFIDFYPDGLLLVIQRDNGNFLKKYSLKNNKFEDYELELQDNLITKSIKIKDNLYYMEFKDKESITSNLLNLENNNIIKLNHNYDYLIGVGL